MPAVDTMRMWQYASVKVNLDDAIKTPRQGPDPHLRMTSPTSPADDNLSESGIGSSFVRRPTIPDPDFWDYVVAAHASVTAFKEDQLVSGGLSHTRQNGALATYPVIVDARL